MSRKQLNHQQLEVLRWIGQGCPAGQQPAVGFKLSAQALQSRRLAVVSRRGGRWAAEITDDGRHYLRHGDYPSTASRPRTSRLVVSDAAVPASGQAPRQRPQPADKAPAPIKTLAVEKKAKPVPPPNQGDRLIADLVAAGGRIVVKQEYGVGAANWSARITSASRSKHLPDGKYVSSGWCRDGLEILLKDVPAWRTEVLDPITIPERLTNPHAIVAAFRDGKRELPLTKAVMPRALRLAQAMLVEAEHRGYKTKLAAEPSRSHYRRRADIPDQFTIATQELTIGVAFVQQSDRVEHVATARELADAKKYSWTKIPRYDYVPAPRLTIRLVGGQVHRCLEWSDSKTHALEHALPQILHEIGLRSTAAVAKRKAEEEAAALKRKRWESAMSQARLDYFEAARVGVLNQQMRDWKTSSEVHEYLAMVERAVADMASDADRAAAEEWVSWIGAYADRLNPLAGSLRMPEIPEPRHGDLEPFLRGWSPYGP